MGKAKDEFIKYWKDWAHSDYDDFEPEFISDVEKMVTAEIAEAMAGRPIETAPKDGSEILVCTKMGFRCIASWEENDHGSGHFFGAWGGAIGAKYWWPLPTPPQEENEPPK